MAQGYKYQQYQSEQLDEPVFFHFNLDQTDKMQIQDYFSVALANMVTYEQIPAIDVFLLDLISMVRFIGKYSMQEKLLLIVALKDLFPVTYTMNLTEHQFKEFTDVLCSALETLDCAQKTHCVKVTPVQQANVNGGADDFDLLDFAQAFEACVNEDADWCGFEPSGFDFSETQDCVPEVDSIWNMDPFSLFSVEVETTNATTNELEDDDYMICLDTIDLMRTVEFVDDAIDNFDEDAEVNQQLDQFLWEFVLQCEFFGFNTNACRLLFLRQLMNMPKCLCIQSGEDMFDFLMCLFDLLSTSNGLLNLGTQVPTPQQQPQPGTSRQQESASDDEDDVQVVLDLSVPPEPSDEAECDQRQMTPTPDMPVEDLAYRVEDFGEEQDQPLDLSTRSQAPQPAEGSQSPSSGLDAGDDERTPERGVTPMPSDSDGENWPEVVAEDANVPAAEPQPTSEPEDLEGAREQVGGAFGPENQLLTTQPQEESKADENLPLLQGDEDDRSSMRSERSFEEILKEAANSPLPWDAEDDEDWEAAPSQEISPSVDEHQQGDIDAIELCKEGVMPPMEHGAEGQTEEMSTAEPSRPADCNSSSAAVTPGDAEQPYQVVVTIGSELLRAKRTIEIVVRIISDPQGAQHLTVTTPQFLSSPL